MSAYQLLTGDVLATLETFPDNHFDAVLADPPYGLSFMGKDWDRGVPSAVVFREMLRVLKPGAMTLNFGGTRTFHRLASNIEDGGFEIRDCLSWLYGSGFPKSLSIGKALDKAAGAEREVVGLKPYTNQNVKGGHLHAGHENERIQCAITATDAAKTWDGYGTALKPGWEPVVLAMKPTSGTYAQNALAHGVAGLNIDGCRIGEDVVSVHNAPAGSFAGGEAGRGSDTSEYRQHVGRWPANVLLDEEAAAALDATQPFSRSARAGFHERAGTASKYGGSSLHDSATRHTGSVEYGDSGGPSRFFYCAKVSAKERNAGTEGNAHPTLKPIALTEYLARLILPPKQPGRVRRLLVPYSGTGSEMIGALKAGWDEVVGIELDEAYVAIAKARLAHHVEDLELAL